VVLIKSDIITNNLTRNSSKLETWAVRLTRGTFEAEKQDLGVEVGFRLACIASYRVEPLTLFKIIVASLPT